MSTRPAPAQTASACRSCKAPILWVRTEKQKRMPLDATPVDASTHQRNTFVLRDTASPAGPLAIAATPQQLPGEVYYVSHFATCPHAQEHRRT